MRAPGARLRVGLAVRRGALAPAEGAAVVRARAAGGALARRRGQAQALRARAGALRAAWARLLAPGAAAAGTGAGARGAGGRAAALALLGQQVEAVGRAERWLQGACAAARGEAESARERLLLLADLGRASAARLRGSARSEVGGAACAALAREAQRLERAAGVDRELAHCLDLLVRGDSDAWEGPWASFSGFFEQLLGLPEAPAERHGPAMATGGGGDGQEEAVPDSEPENETPSLGRRGSRKRRRPLAGVAGAGTSDAKAVTVEGPDRSAQALETPAPGAAGRPPPRGRRRSMRLLR